MDDIQNNNNVAGAKNQALPETFKALGKAMSEVEKERLKPGLSVDEYAVLEKASVELRKIERNLIKDVNDKILEQVKKDSAVLKELASDIRARGKRFSSLTLALDKINKKLRDFLEIEKSLKDRLL